MVGTEEKSHPAQPAQVGFCAISPYCPKRSKQHLADMTCVLVATTCRNQLGVAFQACLGLKGSSSCQCLTYAFHASLLTSLTWCRAVGAIDEHKLMALAPSGANTISPEDIKLLMAFNPGLRRHLLDGLGLCFIACLPQSSRVQPSQQPPALPGSAASRAALTTSSGPNKTMLPMPPASGSAESLPRLATKADLVAAAEQAVQQIGHDLTGVIQTALEAAAKDQVSPNILLYDYTNHRAKPAFAWSCSAMHNTCGVSAFRTIHTSSLELTAWQSHQAQAVPSVLQWILQWRAWQQRLGMIMLSEAADWFSRHAKALMLPCHKQVGVLPPCLA